ncbi:MAG: polysaccharide biosynthesis protein [Chloroflexi bacterium]|nr:polysaccharide biosynthesis protein [Chloroflexota bacterium]
MNETVGAPPADGGTPAVGIDLHQLLGRAPLPIDKARLQALFAGRRVLVTGAGGSIGSSLAACLRDWGVARLVLVDSHENSLYELRGQLGSAARLAYRLCDVRLGARVWALLLAERPEVVFHLAAYKHVPLGEENPAEVFGANVLGTLNVLRAAAGAEVERLVYPSTDKAVEPPSVYGASKRLIELLLLAHAREEALPRVGIVRLVNAVGAQGGVIRLFSRQLRLGLPLTLTHERMTRYWISIEEAALSVAQAACLRDSPAIVVPDSGPAVALTTVAQRLASLLRPGAEPQSRFTGLRPGERLEEYLTRADESLELSEQPGVLRVVETGGKRPDLAAVLAAVERLQRLFEKGEDERLREEMFSFVRA